MTSSLCVVMSSDDTTGLHKNQPQVVPSSSMRCACVIADILDVHGRLVLFFLRQLYVPTNILSGLQKGEKKQLVIIAVNLITDARYII